MILHDKLNCNSTNDTSNDNNGRQIVFIARTKLTEFLDSRKLRKTPERFAILEAVFSHNDHFGVDTLYAEMDARSYHVSRSTVYNTIELFCECGIVRKTPLPEPVKLYMRR